MNRTEHNPEALLDAAIAEVTNDGIDPQVVEEASRRAWARIAAEAKAELGLEAPAPRVEHIRSCADFQALMPEYRAGKLTIARRMLLEDHLHECVACRKAMHPETAMKPASKVVEMPKRAWTPKRWAIAAMVLIGVGSSTWFMYDRFGPAPAGNRATLLAADGSIYRIADGALQPVAVGAAFAEGDRLRTANGGHAIVRLLDGSTVEVSERAEFSVSADRRNTTVYLGRGRIIVQAAKRNRGHLYIATGESRVAVTGTVFSVNRGVAGSRVSVIEGSVVVQRGGDETELRPGDQATTHPSISKIAITDEIAWSRNFDQHLALLKQFVDLKEKLEAVQMPGLRYSSRLLDSVPEGTNIYISVPNLSGAIADVQRIVTDQANQSPEMRTWLKDGMPEFEQFAQKLTALGGYLGEEITFAFQSCAGFCGVAIADVHRPGLREFITKEMAAVADGKDHLGFRIVDGGAIPATRKGELLVAFVGNRVIVGEQSQFVQAAAQGTTGFSQTPFGRAVADVYRRGTSVVVAVNLQRMIGDEIAGTDAKDRTVFSRAGIDQVKYLIAEQRTVNNRAEYLASVSFDQARRGVASWLAEPGPMGSLGFVSPNAQFASSIVMKDPTQLLEDAISFGSGKSNGIDDIKQTLGIDLKEDVVAALGGEVTFAFDGPMLPTPSWKVILEVNDPAKLQAAIEKIVAATNQKLQAHGKPGVELVKVESLQTPSEGLAWGREHKVSAHVLKLGQLMVPEVHYAFIDGYLVMTPTENLLARAIGDRMSGVSITRSRRFTRLLPRDQRTNFSAMVYQNAGELLSLIAKSGGAVAKTTPEQQKQVEDIAAKVEPMLVCAYGENDRIEIASQGSAWNLLMNSFAGSMLGGNSPNSRGTRAKRNTYR